MASPAPVINPEAVQQLIGSLGREPVTELMDAFLEDSPRLVEEIREGLREGGQDVVHRAAHTLKSNSRTFGLERLAALCQELETLAGAGDLTRAGRLATDVEAAYGPARDAVEDERSQLRQESPRG
jgi:HPt (histidine-containing phosphotransfer) domain-containing protein